MNMLTARRSPHGQMEMVMSRELEKTISDVTDSSGDAETAETHADITEVSKEREIDSTVKNKKKEGWMRFIAHVFGKKENTKNTNTKGVFAMGENVQKRVEEIEAATRAEAGASIDDEPIHVVSMEEFIGHTKAK